MIDNQKSIDGIRSILSKFKDQELFGLTATVTQGLLKNKLETREGAILAIIRYSQDEESFLKRKAVTRDNLFQYLHDNGIEVTLPITKDKLIERVLESWDYYDEQTTPNNNIIYDEQTVPNNIVQVQAENVYEPQVQIVETETSEIDEMAEKFATWFYTLMNQNEYIGTQHFFPDSSLHVRLLNNGEETVQGVQGNSEGLVKLLFNVKQQFNLYFNPNITRDGVRGKMDAHGLVLIMACGTLHVNSIVSGVFEQMFSLARDPCSDNNWKIKNTKLTLRSQSDVTSAPRLCDTDLPRILEITDS